MTAQRWTVMAAVIVMALSAGLPAIAAVDDDRIDELEREIAQLKALLTAAQQDDNQGTEERLEEIERRVEEQERDDYLVKRLALALRR